MDFPPVYLNFVPRKRWNLPDQQSYSKDKYMHIHRVSDVIADRGRRERLSSSQDANIRDAVMAAASLDREAPHCTVLLYTNAIRCIVNSKPAGKA